MLNLVCTKWFIPKNHYLVYTTNFKFGINQICYIWYVPDMLIWYVPSGIHHGVNHYVLLWPDVPLNKLKF